MYTEVMFEQVLELYPDDIDAVDDYDTLLARRGNFDGAVEMYNTAIEIDPDDIPVLCSYGTFA